MADVLVPERLLKKMDRQLDRMEAQEDLMNEKDAAAYLGVAVKTLRNMVYDGTIPDTCYRMSIINKRMFIKSKLILPKSK